jgi:plastocyanin
MIGIRRLVVAYGLIAGMVLDTAASLPVAARGPATQGEQSVEIALSEYAFGPSAPIVAAGPLRLRIVNTGIRRHNLVLLVDGVEHPSPDARPGDVVEWDLAIERPGQYLFWCGEYRHLEKGMVGALTVE